MLTAVTKLKSALGFSDAHRRFISTFDWSVVPLRKMVKNDSLGNRTIIYKEVKALSDLVQLNSPNTLFLSTRVGRPLLNTNVCNNLTVWAISTEQLNRKIILLISWSKVLTSKKHMTQLLGKAELLI